MIVFIACGTTYEGFLFLNNMIKTTITAMKLKTMEA